MRRAGKPTQSPTASIVPRLFDRRTAAAYLSVSVPTLDALRAQGVIVAVPVPAAHRPGERLRVPLFDRHDLDQLVERWKEEA
jgi:hypothetical protein